MDGSPLTDRAVLLVKVLNVQCQSSKTRDDTYPFNTSFRNVCTVRRRLSLFGVCSLFRLIPQLNLLPSLVYVVH